MSDRVVFTAVKELKFCAGHRLFRHGSKCEFFHGHNYRVEVEVRGHRLDEIGRLIDFAVLKQRFQAWLDTHWDHAFLLSSEDANGLAALRMVEPTRYFELPSNPTAECLAQYLSSEVAPQLLSDQPVGVRRVTIWETDSSHATAEFE